ncbi:MAG: hypothetical protein ACREV9_00285 [Burkholderiales bacterium]
MKMKQTAMAVLFAFAASTVIAGGGGGTGGAGAGSAGTGASGTRTGAGGVGGGAGVGTTGEGAIGGGVEGIGATGRSEVEGATGQRGTQVPGGVGTPGAVPPAGQIGSPNAVPPAGTAIPPSQLDPLASDFWMQNSREGFLTREQALGFRGTNRNAVDWNRLDTDLDGRVSQSEWSTYHSPGSIPGSRDFGAGGRPGFPEAPGRISR